MIHLISIVWAATFGKLFFSGPILLMESQSAVADELEEFVGFESFDGATVQDESNVVSGIKITGANSSNGYVYSEQSLREAAPMYDGAQVFLDHSERQSNPMMRSIKDLAGTISGPSYVPGKGIFGSINLLETDAGRNLKAIIKANSTRAGMSHAVLAMRDKSKGVVTSIERVISVDAVAFPATVSSFFESSGRGNPDTDKGDEMDFSKITLEQIKSNRPDLVTQIEAGVKGQQQVDDDAKALKESEAKVAQLQARIDGIEKAQKIREEITAAGLDPSDEKQVSKAFVEQLVSLDDDARKDWIKDRADLVLSSGQGPGGKNYQKDPTTTEDQSSSHSESLKKVIGKGVDEILTIVRS